MTRTIVIALVTLLTVVVLMFLLPSMTSSRDNIVVLPFERIGLDGGSGKDELIMDETITLLSRERSLSVLSRNSSLRLQDRDDSYERLIADMNVRFILEGIVRESEDLVRISVVLTEAETDRCVWAQSYIREPSGEGDYLPEIAHAIVEEVRSKLTMLNSEGEME